MRSRSRTRRTILAAGIGTVVLSAVAAKASASNGTSTSSGTSGTTGANGGRGPGTQALPGSQVFAADTEGYHTFRIPAALKTPSGTVLAFAEGRVGDPDDDGNIDLVLRRSFDDGATWGPLQVVWDDGPNKVGNPVPVVDAASGDIVLLVIRTAGNVTGDDIVEGHATPEQSRRPFVLRSSDDGETWSDPVEITADVKLPTWRHFVFGPGHAIQLSKGEHAGRLIAPGNHSSAPPDGSDDTGAESKYAGVHLAYSDDGGHTWQLGATDENYDNLVNGNESQVLELVDGTVYQSIRDQHGTANGNRAYVRSSDGGESYDGPLVPEEQLVTPVVQGAVQRLYGTDDGDDMNLVLFSAPMDPEDRVNMTIWRSSDEGQTWEEAQGIWEGPSGYSDMVKLSDQRLGLLYEGGQVRNYQEISFARVKATNLTP